MQSMPLLFHCTQNTHFDSFFQVVIKFGVGGVTKFEVVDGFDPTITLLGVEGIDKGLCIAPF